MKSLRRDLFERRLWPLAVVILAAVVAVPFLLHGHGADAAIATPPAATASSGSQATGTQHASAAKHAAPTPTSETRDPFAQTGLKKTSHKSSSASKSSASTATSPTSTTASGAGAGGSSSSTSGSSSSTGSSSSSGSSSSTTSVTTTPVVTTPTTTSPTTSSTGGTPAKTQSWDVFSVDVRVGAPGAAVAHQNIARLMPLPSERSPQVMYMGVSDHGRSAVFALAAGVEVRNLGGDRSVGAFCHPTRVDCALVVIPAGKSVGLIYVSASGADRALILRLVHISSHLTKSAAAVKTARAHVSKVGLCDLKLGDPIGFFDPAEDSVKVASTASCHKVKFTAPFPGSLGAGSSVQG